MAFISKLPYRLKFKLKMEHNISIFTLHLHFRAYQFKPAEACSKLDKYVPPKLSLSLFFSPSSLIWGKGGLNCVSICFEKEDIFSLPWEGSREFSCTWTREERNLNNTNPTKWFSYNICFKTYCDSTVHTVVLACM